VGVTNNSVVAIRVAYVVRRYADWGRMFFFSFAAAAGLSHSILPWRGGGAASDNMKKRAKFAVRIRAANVFGELTRCCREPLLTVSADMFVSTAVELSFQPPPS
jgi:hypothetical protein